MDKMINSRLLWNLEKNNICLLFTVDSAARVKAYDMVWRAGLLNEGSGNTRHNVGLGEKLSI